MRATGVWWARVKLLCGCGVGMGIDRGCVVCALCFRSLFGSWVYGDLNRWWSARRGDVCWEEDNSSFQAGGDV